VWYIFPVLSGKEHLTMKIVSIAVSKKKGTVKTCVDTAQLIENHGINDDAHAGNGHRQISFLAAESIENARQTDPEGRINFGDFAENVATEGIDWKNESVGRRFRLGDNACVEITQIGKKCHKKCAIFYRTGDCIMPKEGVFAKILTGGTIRTGDRIEPIEQT
jgi:MOSC domain-containing protein YiiM